MKNGSDIKQAVKEFYAGQVAKTTSNIEGIGQTNYAKEELAGIPKEAVVNSFGCGNPMAFAGVEEGHTVLDIGSGAGLDAIIAASKVGPEGMVIGLDMTPEMIQQAEKNVRNAGLSNVRFMLGDAENIPLEAESVDWVISNCVINLSPNKEQVFREIFRILKPGGRIMISDIVAENLPIDLLNSISIWAGCLAGAIREKDYLAVVAEAGLHDVQVLDRIDYDLTIAKPFIEEHLPGKGDILLQALVQNGGRASSIRLSATKH